jgi:GNAT superfamily N-acetyltransferase
MTLRNAIPGQDFPRIAELLSLINSEAVTVEGLEEDEARTLQGKFWQRWVVEDDTGRVVGYAMVIKYPSQPTGLFNLELVIDPDHRRRGVGEQLIKTALAYGREHGMQRLLTEISDSSSDAMRFAQKWGFAVSHHVFDSTLSLAGIELSKFDGVIERVEQQGVRFFTLAETGKTDDALRRLYEINRMAVLDEPGSTGGFPIYENWLRIVINGSWYRSEGQYIAAEGDTYVGLAGVHHEVGMPETMFNGLTGVRPEYRQRGIATALKLLTIRHAIAYGAQVITTNNDERNTAMLAINRKFGYQPLAGRYVMELHG